MRGEIGVVYELCLRLAGCVACYDLDGTVSAFAWYTFDSKHSRTNDERHIRDLLLLLFLVCMEQASSNRPPRTPFFRSGFLSSGRGIIESPSHFPLRQSKSSKLRLKCKQKIALIGISSRSCNKRRKVSASS